MALESRATAFIMMVMIWTDGVVVAGLFSLDAGMRTDDDATDDEGFGGVKMPLLIEVEQDNDGRWLAEVPELPGVMTDGQTRQEAIERAQILTLRVLADRLDHGEPVPQTNDIFAVLA